jgi:hypothetical protein
MDQYGDKIRSILAKADGAMTQAQGAMSKVQAGMGGSGQAGGDAEAGCYMRNLRGECANPNLTGEHGAMSWREYDALKAAGKDPEEVSYHNLNKPRPWLNDPRVRGRR